MSTVGILAIIAGLLVLAGVLYGLHRWRARAQFQVGAKAFVLTLTGVMTIFNLWLVIGAHISPAFVGWVFASISAVSFGYTLGEKQFKQAFHQHVANSNAVILGRSLLLQCMGGLLTGVLLIVVSGFTGFTIAVPQVSFSIAGDGFLQWLTTTIIAPLCEEPFFLLVIPDFLTTLFTALFGNRYVAMGTSLFLSSLIFAAFHWFAYGASLSLAIGAFTGAAIFRFLMISIELAKEGELSVTSGARTLAVTIPAHFVFNTYVYAAPFFIAGNPGGSA